VRVHSYYWSAFLNLFSLPIYLGELYVHKANLELELMRAYNICLVFTLYLHVLSFVIEERNHFGFLVIHYAVHLASYMHSAPLLVNTLLELEVNSRFLFFTVKSNRLVLVWETVLRSMWNSRRITVIERSLSTLKSYVIEQLVI